MKRYLLKIPAQFSMKVNGLVHGGLHLENILVKSIRIWKLRVSGLSSICSYIHIFNLVTGA